MLGLDAGVHVEQVLAGLDRHDDLFQRGVAGTLAEAVDSAFHLARTGHHRGQGVGHGQTEVVMAVHGEHRLVGIGDALEQLADGVGVLVRNGVADRVRNVDGACPGVDGSLDDAAEEIDLRAAGVLAGKLHVGAQAARLLHRAHCLLHHLVRLHAQLVLHVDRAGGDKGVDAPGVGAGQRFGSAFDVGIDGARQAAHGAVLMLSATSFTAAKSPGLAMAKPASITSTFSRSSARAMRSFSSPVMDAPGLCSPSRRVVSKMMTRSLLLIGNPHGCRAPLTGRLCGRIVA